MAERDAKTGQFLQGKSGNPNGRPVGARSKLGEAFLKALQEDFDQNGEAVIATVRADKPDQYLKVIAGILPKEMTLTVNDPLEDMTDDELAARLQNLHGTLSAFIDGRGRGADSGAGEEKGANGSSPVH